MSYNDKKFLDVNGLKHLISILDDYPTNEVLGTVINAIESEIPTNVSQLQNDAGYLTTHQDISGKANSADLAAVATSGDYDDLINKPTIPAVPVQDVQVNGTSILSQGIANIPLASTDDLGVVKTNENYGTQIAYGNLALVGASGSDIQAGTNGYKILAPKTQHTATFYGLAKAAGVDMASYSSAVGTYPETAKSAIRNMLGAASSDVITISDTQPTNTDTKVWLPETQAAGVQVPTMEDLGDYVQKTDIASSTDAGIVKVSSNLGVYFYPGTNYLGIQAATTQYIKAGTTNLYPIAPNTAHSVAFYGLAKAAGDTTQAASDNAVGTYTADASAAIRSMLGAVGDVQINGTSVVSNGVASIPIANGGNQFGVTKVLNNYTIGIAYDSAIAGGTLRIAPAVLADIQNGAALYLPIAPARQHMAAFYGLAKAAGDTTQSASDNADGTYTAEAKSAIQSMLGIDLQSIASEVEIPLVETVSGTTPSITGQPNTRYNCGEVSTLSITPPSAGSIDVIFDSGSTPAVITVPNTVRWPAWFDATALEADTTYEILITDGVYGSVMTWAN